jgi:acetyl esterase
MTVGAKPLYQPRDGRDLVDLLAAQPLAWVVSGSATDLCATPLPLQMETDAEGAPVALVGHFARNNAQLAMLGAQPEAMILVMGPQAYVSPSWFADRTQAPTWNYTCAMFRVHVALEDDPASIAHRLDELIAASEAGRPRAWSGKDMGARYASLSRGVVGFRAAIIDWKASFKLGQDERDDVFADILAGLGLHGEHELVAWMARFAGEERMGRIEGLSTGPVAPAADRPPLDPDIARFVATVVEDSRRLAEGRPGDLTMQRRIAEQVRRPWTLDAPRMARVREMDVPGTRPVRLRIYEPENRAGMPALVYLHGGGWTLFSLDTHDRLMREYATRAGIAVIAVDYALAPEHKYPYALQQSVAAVRWLRNVGVSLGIGTTRLVLGGDSAGGNLAMATALALRDAGAMAGIDGLLLNYAAFDAEVDAESRRRLGSEVDMLTSTEIDLYWDNYLRDDADRADPFACPGRADPTGLPPALLIVPECDLLAAQSLAIGERFREAGVAVTQHIYPGATHSFLEAMSISPLALRAIDDSARWLRSLWFTDEKNGY